MTCTFTCMVHPLPWCPVPRVAHSRSHFRLARIARALPLRGSRDRSTAAAARPWTTLLYDSDNCQNGGPQWLGKFRPRLDYFTDFETVPGFLCVYLCVR